MPTRQPEELKKKLKGVIGILNTPFTDTCEFDEQGMRRHVNFLVEHGMVEENGIMVTTGSMGECAELTIKKRKKVLETVLDEVKNAIPVIAGCNHNNVYDVIDLAKHAEDAGAAGIMLTPPYYFKSVGWVDEAVVDFYELVADAIKIGIYVYNNPDVARGDMSIPLLAKLAQIDNVVGLKECTWDFYKFGRSLRELGDKIVVTNGHGISWEPYATMMGSPGFISGVVNFAPDLIISIWKALSKKDFDNAKQYLQKIQPFLDFWRKEGAKAGQSMLIAIIRAAIDMVGSSPSGPGRIPIPKLNKTQERELFEALRKAGLLK